MYKLVKNFYLKISQQYPKLFSDRYKNKLKQKKMYTTKKERERKKEEDQLIFKKQKQIKLLMAYSISENN